MINKAIIIGHVGKDPEVRQVGESKVANFSIATTERYKDKNGQVQEQTEWHNIVIWGALAEIVEKYVRKGAQVYLEGKIRTRSYEDKDGQKRYVTEILGNTLKLLGHKPEGSQQGATRQQDPFTQPAQPEVHIPEDLPDDLPF